jgi:hypothetical protein
MPVQNIRLPRLAAARLGQRPRVTTDSPAERAWVPAYGAPGR